MTAEEKGSYSASDERYDGDNSCEFGMIFCKSFQRLQHAGRISLYPYNAVNEAVLSRRTC